MPYVQFAADGSIDALFLHESPDLIFLPLSDARVLQFLQASDPALATAMLNASDDAHRVLLSSLIDLLARKDLLNEIQPREGRLVPHMPLTALIDTVETDDAEAMLSLSQSDRNTVRIIEDVIDALVARGVLSPDDLPKGARNLLAMRRALRVYLADRNVDLEEEAEEETDER
jgi:hypothetical protein